MLERATLLVVLVVLSLAPSIAAAQEVTSIQGAAMVRAQDRPSEVVPPAPSQTPVTIGARVWGTTGHSSLSIGTRTIDTLSELRWRGIDSVVGEINVEAQFTHVFLLGSVGGGAIDDGVLIDDDFSASNHQDRTSHTRSDIRDSGLAYINADVGKNLFHWKTERGERGFVDVLLGGQAWFEEYVAFGATGFPNTATRGQKVSTVDFLWLSLRTGLRADIPIGGPVGLRFRGYFIPVSYFYSEDTHHLRGDLKQNPSFRDSAWGGFGEQLEGAMTFSLWRHRLFAEAGYRYWRIESGSGTDTARTLNGDVHQKFNGATTERYGPYVGIQFRF